MSTVSSIAGSFEASVVVASRSPSTGWRTSPGRTGARRLRNTWALPRQEVPTRMIRLSVFYPATEGATFDHDYYRNKHIPLCLQTWGLESAEIDKGVSGPYVATQLVATSTGSDE
jgi:hypothetical protein